MARSEREIRKIKCEIKMVKPMAKLRRKTTTRPIRRNRARLKFLQSQLKKR